MRYFLVVLVMLLYKVLMCFISERVAMEENLPSLRGDTGGVLKRRILFLFQLTCRSMFQHFFRY